jgi:hypothetical protein
MDKLIDQLKSGDPETWLFIFAIYCLALGGFALFYCLRIRRWSSVFGELKQTNVELLSTSTIITRDQNYFAQVSYTYNVDGKEYQGRRLSPFIIIASYNLRFLLRLQMKHVETRDDGRIRVFYNPQRPEKSYLIPPRTTGLITVISVMFLPLIMYFFY